MRNRDPEALEYADPLYVSIPVLPGASRRGRRRGRARRAARVVRARRTSTSPRRDPTACCSRRSTGGIDLALFPDRRRARCCARFSARVGRTPLPPLLGARPPPVALGLRAARARCARCAREIRAPRHPDATSIHLDIDYMDGYRVFTWHPKRFPDPRGLLRGARAQGFRVVCDRRSGREGGSGATRVYRDGVARDVFCERDDGSPFTLRVWPGEAALPDFNREEVRALVGRAAPPAARRRRRRHLERHERAGRLERRPAPRPPDAAARASRISRAWCRRDPSGATRERPARGGAQPLRPSSTAAPRARRSSARSPERRRPFVLTRSGYAGIQRYAAVWTGDNASRWSHLRGSIPMLLNLSLSGVAFCGADIGGFFRSCTPELYARWIQLGALYPFARTHSMWASRAPGAVALRRARGGDRARGAAAAHAPAALSLWPLPRGRAAAARRSGARSSTSSRTTRTPRPSRTS